MACPNLSGNYICEQEDDNGKKVLVKTSISQRLVEGNTAYTIIGEGDEPVEIVADGKSYIDGSYETVNSCINDKLVLSIKGSENGLDILVNVEIYLQSNQLLSQTSMKVTQNSIVVSEESIISACQKL
tara:strand:- start:698 stop:1081 length:384 start_codon:yes stop_codon:yes gene_type:complete